MWTSRLKEFQGLKPTTMKDTQQQIRQDRGDGQHHNVKVINLEVNNHNVKAINLEMNNPNLKMISQQRLTNQIGQENLCWRRDVVAASAHTNPGRGQREGYGGRRHSGPPWFEVLKKLPATSGGQTTCLALRSPSPCSRTTTT